MWSAKAPDGWNRQNAVILAHGAGGGMNTPFMAYFHDELSARGILTVKFEFEYMQQKRKAPDPQPKLRQRYRQVIEEVQAELQPVRTFVGGKSMGGRVASYIAGDLALVKGLVFLGYPLHPPGKPDQLRDEHLYSLERPMLFVSGTRDTLARRDLLEQVVSRIGQRATMVWIEGGDHSLKTGRKSDNSLQLAADAIIKWIGEHSG
jgi:predicted alpha/beta-hydrolase family hydrolase